MERASSGFYCGFLRGLFDADGSVQGTQAKGVSVRLAQSDLDLLQSVQRMLLRLGIHRPSTASGAEPVTSVCRTVVVEIPTTQPSRSMNS